jgi:hypothetical protein
VWNITIEEHHHRIVGPPEGSVLISDLGRGGGAEEAGQAVEPGPERGIERESALEPHLGAGEG